MAETGEVFGSGGDGTTAPRRRGQHRERSDRSVRASRAARDSLLVALLAIVVALAALPLITPTSAKVGPGSVTASVAPSVRGETVLALPPLGRLSADTHRAPAAVQVRLDEIDPTAVQRIAKGGTFDRDALARDVSDDLPDLFRRLLVRTVLLTAGLGAVVALVLPRRGYTWRGIARRTIVGALAAPLVSLALAAWTAADFEASAFDSARFSGPLSMARPLLDRAGGSLSAGLEEIDERSRVLSRKIADLYSSSIDADVEASSGETVILHVSDIHLNPVGISLARELAETFDVDAVIDTGDLTSFGQEPEARMVRELSRFDVPYYFVAGNHDGAGARRAIARIPGVEAIDGEAVTVGEVRIVGVDDPTETALKTIPKEEIRATYEAQWPRITELVEDLEPDLLAVHNPVQATPAMGTVPLVIAGHRHEFDLSRQDGTVLSVVGSSGATGLGALMVETTEEYAFRLLRFDGSELVAVDSISLRGTYGEFVSERTILRPDTRLDDSAEILEDLVLEPAADDPEVLARREDESDEDATTTTSPTPSTGPGDDSETD